MNTTFYDQYALRDLIAAMADDRRTYAEQVGIEVTDDEIADDIKRSLVRMMSR